MVIVSVLADMVLAEIVVPSTVELARNVYVVPVIVFAGSISGGIVTVLVVPVTISVTVVALMSGA